MKSRAHILLTRLLQILTIAGLSFLINYVVVVLSHDDSLWLGECVEVVGSVFWGPVVGGLGSLISSVLADYLTYGNLETSFVSLFEAASIALIGVVYRRLNKDPDRFGVREIVVFNFVQIIVNVGVLYLATPPAAVMFFGFAFEGMSREELAEEMTALGNNAFSTCVSIALIGTVLVAICTMLRRKLREQGSFLPVLRSILKPTYLSREYRTRAAEYSVGIMLAIALTMIDGVVSGHILGTDALAAVSLLFPLTSFSTFVSSLITSGCSNLCAIARGEGDYERARRLFSLGLFSTAALGLVQTILFFGLKDLYFSYFSSTPHILGYAEEYYRFYVFVPPFMALVTFLDEMVSSEGDDMLSYAGYLISFAVNVGMSIVLCNTIGMGGLALGTLFSYMAYLVVVSMHFLKKSNTLKIRPWFSFRDLFAFAENSLKSNTTGLCMFIASVAFTKAILLFWGSEYLIVNTVLIAMLEVYDMINGPSEAAEYLFATYYGEKNQEGVKLLFRETLSFCLFGGLVVAFLFLLLPNLLLLLYDIEDTPIRAELIKCIRYCAVGTIAASAGGFLSDYYGNTGKPLWSCMMVIFRTALFPGLFCVTFCLSGGIVMMGIGMLLSQVFAMAIFYAFVMIIKGSECIPYMLEEPDFDKVEMNSFEFMPEEYERIGSWITERLKMLGMEDRKTEEIHTLLLSLLKNTEEKNKGKRVLGECVFRHIDRPEIIIKDNGELMKPDILDERLSYHVLMSCNSNKITA